MKRVINWIGTIFTILFISAVLIFAGVLIFAIVGQYDFTQTDDGRMCFGVSKVRRDVFCISCEWDGGDMSYTIPDEFMGYPVTTLGGYTGRGFPCPFGVRISDDAIVYDYGWDENGFEAWHQEDDDFEILTFSVHIGANIEKFDGIVGKYYLVKEEDVLYKIVYHFTVDENNKTFYAKDGKLFYRESNEEVSEFFYE